MFIEPSGGVFLAHPKYIFPCTKIILYQIGIKRTDVYGNSGRKKKLHTIILNSPTQEGDVAFGFPFIRTH